MLCNGTIQGLRCISLIGALYPPISVPGLQTQLDGEHLWRSGLRLRATHSNFSTRIRSYSIRRCVATGQGPCGRLLGSLGKIKAARSALVSRRAKRLSKLVEHHFPKPTGKCRVSRFINSRHDFIDASVLDGILYVLI